MDTYLQYSSLQCNSVKDDTRNEVVEVTENLLRRVQDRVLDTVILSETKQDDTPNATNVTAATEETYQIMWSGRQYTFNIETNQEILEEGGSGRSQIPDCGGIDGDQKGQIVISQKTHWYERAGWSIEGVTRARRWYAWRPKERNKSDRELDVDGYFACVGYDDDYDDDADEVKDDCLASNSMNHIDNNKNNELSLLDL